MPRRGSQPILSFKEKPFKNRSNSISSSNHEMFGAVRPDIATLKKRPSLLGSKVRYGSKEGIQNSSEKHSVVVLGVGGVGKTGQTCCDILMAIRAHYPH